jgi:cytochrome c553
MACAAEEPPAWAYPVNPPDWKPAPDDGTIRRVPGSTAGFTLSQVRDLFLAPDWHPDSHPPMPPVVAKGVKPEVAACGFCHRAEGTGGPENSSVAGLPAAYIVQQMADYRSGARSTALPARAPQRLMMRAAKSVSDDDVKAAAAYFAGLKPKANIRIVESETAPKTFVANWFLAALPGTEREPIGQRIIEVPDDLEHFESRDSRMTFTATVPPGSLAKGRALVAGEDPGRTLACAACHGKDLRGADAIPSIAGRSPTYIFRQLYEFHTGARAGAAGAPMKEIVAKLGHADMIAIAAYLGTLPP